MFTSYEAIDTGLTPELADHYDRVMHTADMAAIAKTDPDVLVEMLRDVYGYPVPAAAAQVVALVQAIESWKLPAEYDGRDLSEFEI